MDLQQRIRAFARLGEYLLNFEIDSDVIANASSHNQWFTEENIHYAIKNIAINMLKESSLNKWLRNYNIHNTEKKTIALILAGNIPAVGFHDILCVLLVGYNAQIKLSSKDQVLIRFLLDKLIEFESSFSKQIEFVEQVKDFHAIIATGSNNSQIYFGHYFSKYPSILRRNRKSVAVIFDDTSEESIREIGEDIFRYFGLGCRNVSKILISKAVSREKLMKIWHENKSIVLHNKYKNNFDYNYTVMLLNQDDFLMNGAILLRENESLHSRIACLHCHQFKSDEELQEILRQDFNEIQCIVSDRNILNHSTLEPGNSQKPNLDDYADNIDTIQFLVELK